VFARGCEAWQWHAKRVFDKPDTRVSASSTQDGGTDDRGFAARRWRPIIADRRVCERFLVSIRPHRAIGGVARYCIQSFRAGCGPRLGYRRLQSGVDLRASAGGPNRRSVRTSARVHDRRYSLRLSVGTVCDRDHPLQSIGLARVARISGAALTASASALLAAAYPGPRRAWAFGIWGQ
jgi:hypothetical protein